MQGVLTLILSLYLVQANLRASHLDSSKFAQSLLQQDDDTPEVIIDPPPLDERPPPHIDEKPENGGNPAIDENPDVSCTPGECRLRMFRSEKMHNNASCNTITGDNPKKIILKKNKK